MIHAVNELIDLYRQAAPEERKATKEKTLQAELPKLEHNPKAAAAFIQIMDYIERKAGECDAAPTGTDTLF